MFLILKMALALLLAWAWVVFIIMAPDLIVAMVWEALTH